MEFVLNIVIVLLLVCIAALIAHFIVDKKGCNYKISFRESMDLTELPIITFYNNGKKYNFLLDSGANNSVIDASTLNGMSYEIAKELGTLYGMEGNKSKVLYANITLKYKDNDYEDKFQVVDMSAAFGNIKAESGVNLSGILGTNFFTKYQYVLDFEEMIAYFRK